jgi:hypothetical protein
VVRTGGGGSGGVQEEAFYDPRYGIASLRNQHRFSTRLPSSFSKWWLMALPEINQYAGRHSRGDTLGAARGCWRAGVAKGCHKPLSDSSTASSAVLPSSGGRRVLYQHIKVRAGVTKRSEHQLLNQLPPVLVRSEVLLDRASWAVELLGQALRLPH